MENMKKETIIGLSTIVVIVAIIISTGCIEGPHHSTIGLQVRSIHVLEVGKWDAYDDKCGVCNSIFS
jgi:hypothetical protein